MITLTDNEPDRRYTDGQIIEYTSFASSGFSKGRVIGYAFDVQQDDPHDLRVIIRAESGGKPFPVRESQIRIPGRYTAHITPQAWQRDQAIEVDAPGPQEWECTEFARGRASYMQHLARDQGPIDEVVDNDDLFKQDPAAPAWVRAWTGPLTITIRRETQR